MENNNLKKYLISREGFLINPICDSASDVKNRIEGDFKAFVHFKFSFFDNVKIRKVYYIYEINVYQQKYKLIGQVVKEL